MRPAAAFAVGLWTGAVVVAAVGAFQLRLWQGAKAEPAPRQTTDLEAKEEELLRLRQENTRSTAEAQRLRQTVADLKNTFTGRAASDSQFAVRRIPFRRGPATEGVTSPSPITPALPPAADAGWIADAVARGDADSVARLEDSAAHNNVAALDALAVLADRGGGEALLRVWDAESLNFPNKVRVTQYIGNALEATPHAAEWLSALFALPKIDTSLLYAGLYGVANPGLTSAMATQNQRLASAPQVRPDLAARIKLFDTLRAAVTDERLSADADKLRETLVARAAEAVAAPPAP